MKLEILTSGRRNPAVTDKCAIGIMIKAPRAGFSKTRLSPPLSQEEAANISRCFLKDTTAAIDALSQKDPVMVGIAISWSLWNYRWIPPAPGSYAVAVRATDGTGALQSSEDRGTVPQGSTGLHRVLAAVT